MAVQDGIPGEYKVAQAVRSLKRGRDGGLSVMRAEDLKGWLRDESRDTDPVTYWWLLLVRIIQKTFKEVAVLEELAWATIFFLLKGRGEVSGDRICRGGLEGLQYCG